MTEINRYALVPYSAGEMYALVEDVNAYPEFLPWCKSAEILVDEGDEVEAGITLARAGLEKMFTTRNTLVPDESIEIRLLQGPFQHLHGQWLFQPLGDMGCKVSLHMNFEISNRLLKVSLGPFFTQIMDALVDAFVKRAQDLYGKR